MRLTVMHNLYFYCLLYTSADQNGVVKRYDLPSALPEAAEDFSTVPAGQLVLEGTGGLRLFYQESPAGGSYTPLATLRETEGPVSYTHLDVYKRQLLKW